MAGASAGFHENESSLSEELKDRHRALVSIMEELEAVDWYDQRVQATNDADLAEVLGHNRDEEKEHAAMTIEWLRRHDSKWDQHLRTYLFTDDDVLEIEEEAEHESGGADGAGDLGIGSLTGGSNL
jgi:ferritin-like protein